ncbi:MAG: family 1 glycosylhydrolase [Chloroflexia bacterium]
MKTTNSKVPAGTSTPPELWGGVECTVNRVGDHYFDQFERSGHSRRIRDLDLFARLGISRLRYPVLWERIYPNSPDTPDWAWADRRLAHLRDLALRPIVGLVHHGSGPRYTNLLDPGFPEGLAHYGRAVAERYPWVDAYTPVNEPLTTARFSGLYGFWYPHGRDDRSFVRALLNQCRAVALAMRAIREVNPNAILVQTEDLGKTYSTEKLAYQAGFDNERRWLTFDLLCGRITPRHRMWGYLRGAGATEVELHWFTENPCPPDMLGANYYLSSERFLDHRLELYPQHTHGGNGRHRYADLEAARVRAQGLAGPGGLLAELWERYKLPIAVTEAHNGCTREEQLRWFVEVWDAAQARRAQGADVRAVTAWALLGSYDWDSLLTLERGHYEPGVFDARSSPPRPTAIAHLLREIASGKQPTHPTLGSPGWWRRDMRLAYGVSVIDRNVLPTDARRATGPSVRAQKAPPLLIVGATGTLGRAFARMCFMRGLPYVLLSRRDMDISDQASIGRTLDEYKPWAVVNAAGYVRVDDAEGDSRTCFQANTDGPAALAAACAPRGVQLLTFSSDLVFDGRKGAPYLESDPVSPLNVYGRSKAEAEAQVLGLLPSALVVRTSAFFGPWDQYNFVIAALRTLAAGKPFEAGSETVSPTYVPDLVNTSLDLLIDGESGIWHLANSGAITWAGLARKVAALPGLNEGLVQERPSPLPGIAAPRPAYTVLGSERGSVMPTLHDALERFLRDCEVEWQTPAPVLDIDSPPLYYLPASTGYRTNL